MKPVPLEPTKRLPAVYLEWAAALAGMSGAALVAVCWHMEVAFVLYLVSNVAWIGFSLRHRIRGLLVQQVVFTATSLCGLWTWWLEPLLKGAAP